MKRDYTTMTPREYAASRRSLPFGAARLSRDGSPDWRKIGRGMIAAVDGNGDNPMIYPGCVYTVEIHGSQIGIAAYHASRDGEQTYRCGRLYATLGLYQIAKWPMTYDEMMAEVRAVCPTIWAPDPIDWYREYGLSYDEATGEIRNPRGLREDD